MVEKNNNTFEEMVTQRLSDLTQLVDALVQSHIYIVKTLKEISEHKPDAE